MNADINTSGAGWIQVTISGPGANDLTEAAIEAALAHAAVPDEQDTAPKFGKLFPAKIAEEVDRDPAYRHVQQELQTLRETISAAPAPVQAVDRKMIAAALDAKLVAVNTKAYGNNRDDWRFLRTHEIVDAVVELFTSPPADPNPSLSILER